jgi:ABC-type uncharacterized transport system permease subunit
MSLASALPVPTSGGVAVLVAAAVLMYLVAAVPVGPVKRMSAAALVGGWSLHLLLVLVAVVHFGQAGGRWGFGPVLSMTVWLVIAVHTVESRLLPLPQVRVFLGAAGALAVLLAAWFPGEARPASSVLAPLHFALGVGSYGLFGAAVLHAVLLDRAERRLRGPGRVAAAPPVAGEASAMPLLQLERLTFRFVEAGFVVLTATLALGVVSATAGDAGWRWDHKTVFSLLAWSMFAALLVGRRLRGWRGHQATRWLYAGALLLLLAYAGSRFVWEVMLDRPLT